MHLAARVSSRSASGIVRSIMVLGSFLLGLASSLLGADGWRADRPERRAAEVLRIPQLHRPAHLIRDRDGIAHIIASNDHDVFLLNGWVHAEDRLFQIDLLRRQATGTLAELLGSAVLESDVQLRTLGLRRSAEASLEVLLPETVDAFEAYAEGVNAWVDSHDLPAEYGALEITRFEPWTAVDSVVIAKVIIVNLAFDLGAIERSEALAAYGAAGAEQGFDGEALFFEDMFRAAPFDPAATVPDALAAEPLQRGHRRYRRHESDREDHRFQIGRRRPADAAQCGWDRGRDDGCLSPAMARLCRDFVEKARRVPTLKRALEDRDHGSNVWAVTGALTESGAPILAHDPHLALGTPSTLYPIHLSGRRLDVIGSELPGIPIIVLGHNRWVAWAGTVNRMDQTDVFQETVVEDPGSPSGLSTMYLGELEPIIPIPEAYRVNQPGNGVLDDVVDVPTGAGLPAATLFVPRRNGPIIALDLASGSALSVQFAGFYATREGDMFILAHRARGLEQFRSATRFFDGGSQNWCCVDSRGRIGYFTSGELPLREDLENGEVVGLPPYLIRNGQGGNEWLARGEDGSPDTALPFEVLPFEDMPHVVDPPGGWFVNANNTATGNPLDNDPLNRVRPGGGIFYFESGYFSRGFRAGRITQLVRAQVERGELFSTEDMQRIQSDVTLLDAQVFVPYILSAFENAGSGAADPKLAAFTGDSAVSEAVARLADWDFTTPTGIAEGYDATDSPDELSQPAPDEVRASVAATIYAVWRGQVLRQGVDRTLEALGLPVPTPGSQAVVALRHLLDDFEANDGRSASGLEFFAVDGVDAAADRRDIVILQSLRDGLDLLASEAFAPAFAMSTDQDDYRWGKLHRIVFAHPLRGPFSVPPAGGAFPAPLEGLPGIPTDGGFNTVDASTHGARASGVNDFMFSSGPSGRFVYEARLSGVRAVGSWPGGTSGVLGSPFYDNLLDYWLTNEARAMLVSLHQILSGASQVQFVLP